jgi:hypothetical protein
MLVTMARMLPRFEAAGLLLCLLLAGCGRPSKEKDNPEGVKQRLAAAIPLHSSPTQVLNYLDSQEIKHSSYHRDTALGNTIEGVIFVKSASDIVDPSYEVVFRFDAQDRLIAYDVQWLGYI